MPKNLSKQASIPGKLFKKTHSSLQLQQYGFNLFNIHSDVFNLNNKTVAC